MVRVVTAVAGFAAVVGLVAVSQQQHPATRPEAGPAVPVTSAPGPAASPVPSSPAPSGPSTPSPSSGSSAAPHGVLNACERTLELARRMGTSFDVGDRRVDVLGDSYSVGTTLTEPRTQAWDVLMAHDLGWRLTVRGIGRTGFVNGGTCGGRDYQTRVEQVLADRPQLVVVQGGLNDVGYVGRVWQAATKLLTSIPDDIQIVVVGPPAAPAFRYTAEQQVDQTLREAVAATHGVYISTLGWPLTYASDGIHLDEAGNRIFAQRLTAALGTST